MVRVMREVRVHISQVVGGEICVSATCGNRLHDIVYEHIAAGNRVCLSFAAVTRLTTAFLNAAIGQLYGEFPHDELRLHLAPPVDTNARQRTQLKLVVDRAKTYFMNPEGSRASFLQAAEIDD